MKMDKKQEQGSQIMAPPVKFDDFLIKVGDFGRFQLVIIFCSLMLCLASGFLTYSAIFILNVPAHRCALPGVPNDTFTIQSEHHLQMVNESIPWDDDTGTWASCLIRRPKDPLNPEQNEKDANSTSTGEDGYETCSRWVFDKSYVELTITEELGLVCDQKVVRTYANMAQMVGKMVASLVVGSCCDLFGRKRTLVVMILMLIAVCFANSFLMISIPFLFALRFLAGICGPACYYSSLILCLEYTTPKRRNMMNVIFSLVWILAGFILAGMALVVRSYVTLGLGIAFPTLLLVSFFWLIPESPRWLLSKNRVKEARQILKKLAKTNKGEFPDELFEGLITSQNTDNTATDQNNKHHQEKEMESLGEDVLESEKGLVINSKVKAEPSSEFRTESFREVFRHRKMLVITVVMLIEWFIISTVYYAIMFNVTNLSGSLQLNLFLLCCVDFAVNAASFVFIDRIGRKLSYLGLLLTATCGCFASIFPSMFMSPGDARGLTYNILALIGRGGVSAGFNLIILYSAELFPTTIRSTAVGACGFASKLGSTLSPYVADLGMIFGGKIAEMLPLVVCGCLGLLGSVVIVFVPETVGKNLPHSVADVLQFWGETKTSQHKARQPEEDEQTKV